MASLPSVIEMQMHLYYTQPLADQLKLDFIRKGTSCTHNLLVHSYPKACVAGFHITHHIASSSPS